MNRRHDPGVTQRCDCSRPVGGRLPRVTGTLLRRMLPGFFLMLLKLLFGLPAPAGRRLQPLGRRGPLPALAFGAFLLVFHTLAFGASVLGILPRRFSAFRHSVLTLRGRALGFFVLRRLRVRRPSLGRVSSLRFSNLAHAHMVPQAVEPGKGPPLLGGRVCMLFPAAAAKVVPPKTYWGMNAQFFCSRSSVACSAAGGRGRPCNLGGAQYCPGVGLRRDGFAHRLKPGLQEGAFHGRGQHCVNPTPRGVRSAADRPADHRGGHHFPDLRSGLSSRVDADPSPQSHTSPLPMPPAARPGSRP